MMIRLLNLTTEQSYMVTRTKSLKKKTNKLYSGLRRMAKLRGALYTVQFVILDILGNQFGLPISGHKKELIFWEKQIIGIGDFSENFKAKVDLSEQESMLKNAPRTLIDSIRDDNGDRTITVLDVGAGVVSLLSYLHHSEKIKLTATDLLSDEYTELLRIYGHLSAIDDIEMIACPAESLSERFKENTFDFVYCNNALDHTDSPRKSLCSMVAIVKKGGYIMISGHSREGTKENWDGIHNHDLYIENGALLRAGRNNDPIVLSDGLPVETKTVTDPVERFGEMVIVYRKIAD